MNSHPRLGCLSLLNLKPLPTQNIKQTHAQLIINGLQTPSLLAKLIEQYCATSSPLQNTHYAHLLFTHLDKPNLFVFNTLLRCTQPKHSILVFANWVSKATLVFDDHAYKFVLGACARFPTLSTLSVGRQIHVHILKHGFVSNLFVQTTMIHFYASNKDIKAARRVFDEMPMKSSVTWNAMIKGYCSQREKAKECAFNGLLLFRDMLKDVCGVKVTDTTLVCVLSAVSQLGVIETGACVHGYIEKAVCMPENDVYIGTGFVDMYSKCGSIHSALTIFTRMTLKNVLTWTAMATGQAVHGRGKEALELLDKMVVCGVEPNAVTFTSLFSACCHAGLVEEGLYLFYSMESKFGVVPRIQHYGCIVDLLGRAGHLKEAYEFIKGMPIKADAILWRSLLSACKVHGDVLTGEKVGKILLALKPECCFKEMDDASEDYIALSNIYASAERWQEVEMVRKEMKVKRIEINPGSSLVQTSGNQLLNGL